jgi:HEAT repeat protein
MERLKSITIIFLLAVGLLASVASAKTVSVLLQEGLYAEEIEGDLDAAIKIYEQVISESKKAQRDAAHATYRIGMCHLKKGEKTKAAEYFQNIISDFPGQKVLAKKAQKQLDKIKPRAEKIVEQAVMTISTCAEGDPRVTRALESLKGLDENVVVNELVKFLDSETNTVRRSAIYILWKGDLKDISAAVPTLEKLCSHKEDTTRGMSAIALGAAMIKSSFKTLANMTLEDPSGYARRCAAYALGLMGNANAKPILEKALEDSDPLVCNNAKAALAMLTETVKLFPEFVGCRIKETMEMKFTEPSDEWWLKDPSTTKTIYENTQLDIEWEIDRTISGKSEVFAISVLPEGIDIHGIDSSMWFETDIPVTTRKTKYGYPWKGVAGKIGTFRKAKRLVTGEYNVFLYAFGNLSSDRGWQKLLKDNLKGVATVKLNVKPMPYTQITNNDIGADGTIRFKNILQEMNQHGAQITTKGFINSDFVHVKNMFDDEGRPIEFTAKHQGNIYRYNLTFNKPVLPGEAMLYGCEGTITDLIHPLNGTKDVFRYFMAHSPGTNKPTRRIETYRLPEGAELVSTTPKDMAHRTKDGRIELYIEEMIPIGGNITTAFQYRLRKTAGLSVSPNRKLLDERTLIAINNQDRFGAKWFKVEHEYKAASQEKKQRMIEKWMADAQKPDVNIRSRAIASLGNIACKQATDILIKIAKEPMEFSRSNRPRWIAVRSLGRVGDMRAVPVLIDLLDYYNKDTQLYSKVALCEITGVYFGSDKTKWQNWWQEKGKSSAELDLSTPEATVISFTRAAVAGEIELALACFSPGSHDYGDVKELLTSPARNFLKTLFEAVDPNAPIDAYKKKQEGDWCEVNWRMKLKKGFTVEGKTFKAGETFDLDGNVKKVEDRWLIVGI